MLNSSSKSVVLNKIALPDTVAVLGDGMLANNALLSETLQTTIDKYHRSSVSKSKKSPQAFIGWGNKKSFQKAKVYSERLNVPVFSIEDGFLRSIDTGIDSRHALSMVVDDLGIYFDAHTASRLEKMILYRLIPAHWSENHHNEAQRLIRKISDYHLSKYNTATDCPNLQQLANNKNEHVLLIDQVMGDGSIVGAGLQPEEASRQFTKMLQDACHQNPDANIWIKTHPAGKLGYLSELSLTDSLPNDHHRIQKITTAVNPILLLNQVNHVYSVSSHMGFEALMLSSIDHKKTVHCYGVNWYCGWGLTDDQGLLTAPENLSALYQSVKQRRHVSITPKIEALFFSAYLDYSYYVDPATNTACDMDTAINWLITNRHWHHQLRGHLTIYEFSRWKLPFVRQFVGFKDTKLFIKPKPRFKNILHPYHFKINFTDPMLVWGLKNYQNLTNHPKTTRIYCMEDGFIRSNGLGATLLAPLSVVIDRQGIYYNATQPSDLETLLKNCPPLTVEQTARVENLQEIMRQQKVSKYNVGKSVRHINNDKLSWLNELNATDRKKILIVGQVEDDLSVQYCGSTIKHNNNLIEQVKEDNPDAYLIYKPHPDVEAGLRVGKVDSETLLCVNAIADNIAMPECLTWVDEVHTISSLTGFEALLRGKTVVCYGLPFYAGWGLTVDKSLSVYLPRRQRDTPLSLAQLIYCTLIEYPLYYIPNGFGLAQVEQVIDYLYSKDAPVHRLKQAQSPLIFLKIKKMHPIVNTKFMQIRHQLIQYVQRFKP